MTNPSLDSSAYFRKGLQLHNQFQYGQALAFYNRTLQRVFDEKCYHNLGNIHYTKGNYQTAIKKYVQAISVRPYFFLSYNGWGSCLSRLGKYDEAIEKFKKAVDIGDDILAYLNWSLVLFWQKKEAEAEELLEKGLKKTSLGEPRLMEIYRFELHLVEEGLVKAVNEDEKEFLKERADGYNWILEMLCKKFWSLHKERVTANDVSDEEEEDEQE